MDKLIEMMADIPKDKLLHSFYGVLIYLAAALVNPMFGIVTVIVIAVTKELYDEIRYGGFDWKDIIATVAVPMVLFLKECQ